MVVSEMDLFEALSLQLGAEQAKSVVRYVESKVDKRIEDRQSEYVLEKDKDKLLTKADAMALFSSKEEIARLEGKVSETKAEILKWMIVLFAPFYVGMIVLLVRQLR
jgi:hypothetical protein